MIINSKMKEYNVNFKDSLYFINDFIKLKETFFVIDGNVYKLYNSYFKNIPQNKLYILNSLEENKNIDTALEICEILTELPEKRNIRLVSVGGGIVQDVTGFVANVLYRGIYWSYIPTTLLAACDSCIGGKTSLNYKCYKNLLGTFFPPDDIYIYSNFFDTLTDRDFKSGLGEVVKFNVMSGMNGVTNIEQNINKLLKREHNVLNLFVENSLLFKKTFIEKDEFDKGIRIYLNFAHTFGHAFETVSEYSIPHGTAVAAGMLVANRISLSRGMLDTEIVTRIEDICKKIIDIDFKELDHNSILSAIRKDKKQTNDSTTIVILDKNMSPVLVHDATVGEILNAVDTVLSLIRDSITLA